MFENVLFPLFEHGVPPYVGVVPVNSDSPKLVEMTSIKLLSLVWCLLCLYLLQELTVDLALKDHQQHPHT
jgi:hypothetical protein